MGTIAFIAIGVEDHALCLSAAARNDGFPNWPKSGPVSSCSK
jgi:hypothetical protein